MFHFVADKRGARHLFDGMAPQRPAKRRSSVDMEDREDRLGSLPDDLLLTVLSSLPSRDAVRTSVLARRWRDLWKYVRALRVMESHHWDSTNQLNAFVNHVLLLREPVPLEVVEIKSYHDAWDERDEDCYESFRYIEHWVRYALSRGVPALRVCIMEVDMMAEEGNMIHWRLPDKLLISSTLTKLELTRVEAERPCLDFSSCPVLVDLKMEFCDLLVDRITSPLLAQLSITYCKFKSDGRTRISTPDLVSLQLVDCRERTPLLESMPKLVSAFIRLRYSSDYCAENYAVGECGHISCKGCPGSSNVNIPSILLQGLSCAANLELTAENDSVCLCLAFTFCVFSLLTYTVDDLFALTSLLSLACSNHNVQTRKSVIVSQSENSIQFNQVIQ